MDPLAPSLATTTPIVTATAKIARISFGTIPRRNHVATAKKSMTNHIHAIVCSPDAVGMPAPMRKMDPPAVILVITFVVTHNTVFDYP